MLPFGVRLIPIEFLLVNIYIFFLLIPILISYWFLLISYYVLLLISFDSY